MVCVRTTTWRQHSRSCTGCRSSNGSTINCASLCTRRHPTWLACWLQSLRSHHYRLIATRQTATHTVCTTNENYLQCLQLQPALSRACADSNKLQRANSVCVENSTRTWHGRRNASDGFSVCRHSQADLCLKCVVGFRNHHRPETTSGIHSTKSS